ncbi:MAG: SRPBCC family protein [Bradyrhizobiaceae bacterium]|nr:SRPBCC family protein [Hyphomicrobiales bacterium]MBV9428183.1 SRPBCC family protein [Bradyrhizobiaceae bacterium]
MTPVIMTVNGAEVSATVEPRTHLADFLREQLLLTGTHLGCEHGVCGACTILIDGEPARACIVYAATCGGRDVRTIEGLADDPIAAALRSAFTAEHALQCGYCTPGMLVSARDIVRRLPDADEDRIRLELAGNLCRCTGYNGIVRAIRRVLAQRPQDVIVAKPPLPRGQFAEVREAAPTVTRADAAPTSTPGDTLKQTLRLALPRETVWRAVCDPALIASCVPGARVTSVNGDRIAGELVASLGPIEARFAGEAIVTYDSHGGQIKAHGRDPASGTRLSADATFQVAEDGPQASTITLDIVYALRGPLAQFGRGPVVRVFAAEIADAVGRNLEARLRGEAIPEAPRLRAGSLIWRALWRWLRGLIGGR